MNDETKSCEGIQEKLTALRDGELPLRDAATVQAHLGECAACAAVFAEIEQTLSLADAWQGEGREVWASLQEQMSRAQEQMPAQPLRRGGTIVKRVTAADILLQQHYVTPYQLTSARQIQQQLGGDLLAILVRQGYATERDVIAAKAQADRVPFIDLTKHKPEPSALNVVPEHIVRKYNVLPVKKDGPKLWVAMIDPRDIVAIDDIRMVSRCQVQGLTAVPRDLKEAIDAAYPASPPTDSLQLILSELRALRQEVSGLRSEMAEMHTEMASMRRQVALMKAATAPVSPPRQPAQMLPFPPATDSVPGLF